MRKVLLSLLTFLLILVTVFGMSQGVRAQSDSDVDFDNNAEEANNPPIGGADPIIGGSSESATGRCGQSQEGKIGSPLCFEGSPIKSLGDFMNIILTIVIRIGTIVAVMFIIWSGFLFIKAQGNQDEIKKAKNVFFYTILGTAILLGSKLISEVLQNTIGGLTGIKF